MEETGCPMEQEELTLKLRSEWVVVKLGFGLKNNCNGVIGSELGPEASCNPATPPSLPSGV